MAELTVHPVSRMVVPGRRASFQIQTSPESSTIRVIPEERAEHYRVALEGGGLEAPAGGRVLTLEIEPPPGAPLA